MYQCLARGYDLDLENVQFEPDAMPEEAGWRFVEALLTQHSVRVMLRGKAPLHAAAARLEGVGVASVVYAPSANVPAPGDLLDVMRASVDRLPDAPGS